MRRKRRSPTECEKRAACVLMIKRGTGDYIVTRSEAAALTPRQICELFDSRIIYAHGRADALDGSMHPTNIWPTPREEDAKQTPKDISAIAKAKRGAKKTAAHRERLERKYGAIDVTGDLADMPRPKPKSRPMPYGRNSGLKRKLNGKVVERR